MKDNVALIIENTVKHAVKTRTHRPFSSLIVCKCGTSFRAKGWRAGRKCAEAWRNHRADCLVFAKVHQYNRGYKHTKGTW